MPEPLSKPVVASDSTQMVAVDGVPAAMVVPPQDDGQLLASQSAQPPLSQKLLLPMVSDGETALFARDRRNNPAREPVL